VLRGLDPSGRAYSIGEVAQLQDGTWELVISDGSDDSAAWWRAHADTREQAMRLAPGAAVALGGTWPTLDDEIHDYLFRRPGMPLREIIDGTGLDARTVKDGLQRLRRHHRARTEGIRAGARWFAVGLTTCVVVSPVARAPSQEPPEPPRAERPRAAATTPPPPAAPPLESRTADELLEAAIGRAVLDLVRTVLRHASAEASP
jgi:hypothetical protein